MRLTQNDGRLARQVDNLALSVRPQVCNPESSHERDDATRFVGWIEHADAAMSLDDAPSGGWIGIKLTETPDTDPCTQSACQLAERRPAVNLHFRPQQQLAVTDAVLQAGRTRLAGISSSREVTLRRFGCTGGARVGRQGQTGDMPCVGENRIVDCWREAPTA